MEDNIIKVLRCLIVIVLGFNLTGCAPGPLLTTKHEIDETSALWGGYSKGSLYSLKHDVFIRDNSKYTSDQLIKNAKILVPPKRLNQGGLYSSAKSIVAFEANPEKYPEIIGIVEKGTIIKCTKIIEYIPLGYRNSLYIYATIQDGLFKSYLVEISDLSKFYSKSQNGIHLKVADDFFLHRAH